MLEFAQDAAVIKAEVHGPHLVTLHTSFDFAAHPGLAVVIGATPGVENIVGPFRYHIMLTLGKAFDYRQVVKDAADAAFRFIAA